MKSRVKNPSMPDGIVVTTDTPMGYSPEYLPDGQVWLLHNGKRLRLLRDYQEFAIAAQMHGGYADLAHTLLRPKDWPPAPFVWRGAPPQFDPPAQSHPSYLLAFRFAWPVIEVSVPVDHAIWRLWTVVKKSRHAAFIRQFDPVASWFEGFINGSLIFEANGVRYIKLRDLRSEMSRLAALMKAV